MRAIGAVIAMAFATPVVAQAAPLALDAPFSDGAVVQRGQPVNVHGEAAPRASVSVSFSDQTVIAKADKDGKWTATFTPKAAARDQSIVATSGGQTAAARSIAIGDVFLCSGQSNMEFPMSQAKLPEGARTKPADAALHMFTVDHAQSRLPRDRFDPVPRWGTGKEIAADFSAVCFLAGREIAQRQKVEIGLIDASWGGTPIEAWLSPDGVAQAGLDEGAGILAAFRADPAAAEAKYGPMLDERWKMNGPSPRTGYANLYNAMIAPLRDYGLAGALWYQGENNASQKNGTADYRRRLEALLASWRKQFRADLPFVIVQIAGFEPLAAEAGENSSAAIREAQRQVVAADPRAALVVTTDVSERLDIHPPLKLPVAQRAALGLRRLVYREAVSSGPEFARAHLADGAVTIEVTGNTGGLIAASWGRPGPFMLCSAGTCRYADAEIVGTGFRVALGSGPVPDTVRYCYAAAPICNVFDGAGLPLGPFSAPVN